MPMTVLTKTAAQGCVCMCAFWLIKETDCWLMELPPSLLGKTFESTLISLLRSQESISHSLTPKKKKKESKINAWSHSFQRPFKNPCLICSFTRADLPLLLRLHTKSILHEGPFILFVSNGAIDTIPAFRSGASLFCSISAMWSTTFPFTSPSGSHLLPSSLYSLLTTSLSHLNSPSQPPPLCFILLIAGHSEHTVKLPLAPFSHEAARMHAASIHPSTHAPAFTYPAPSCSHQILRFWRASMFRQRLRPYLHSAEERRTWKETRKGQNGNRRVSSERLGAAQRSYWLIYNGCSWRHQSVLNRGGRGQRQRALQTCKT